MNSTGGGRKVNPEWLDELYGLEGLLESGLTLRQADVLRHIAANTAAKGRPPTVRELMAHFRIGSPNGICCHLKALVRKGFIRRDAFKGRGIVLTGVSWVPVRQEVFSCPLN